MVRICKQIMSQILPISINFQQCSEYFESTLVGTLSRTCWPIRPNGKVEVTISLDAGSYCIDLDLKLVTCKSIIWYIMVEYNIRKLNLNRSCEFGYYYRNNIIGKQILCINWLVGHKPSSVPSCCNKTGCLSEDCLLQSAGRSDPA